MALAITHTVLISAPGVETERLSYARIWSAMLGKAGDPLEFVPMITKSKVVEHYPDGFLREVVFFGRDTVLERVRPRPDKYRILFEVINHPRLKLIYNELDRDDRGRFTYTLSTTFSDAFFAAALADADLFEQTNMTLLETAQASAKRICEKACELVDHV